MFLDAIASLALNCVSEDVIVSDDLYKKVEYTTLEVTCLFIMFFSLFKI